MQLHDRRCTDDAGLCHARGLSSTECKRHKDDHSKNTHHSSLTRATKEKTAVPMRPAGFSAPVLPKPEQADPCNKLGKMQIWGKIKDMGQKKRGLVRKDKHYHGQTGETQKNKKKGSKRIVRRLYVDCELALLLCSLRDAKTGFISTGDTSQPV